MVIIWLMMVNNLVGGWATNPSEKYEFVSWDDEIPNIWEKHVPNHQPEIKWPISPSCGDHLPLTPLAQVQKHSTMTSFQRNVQPVRDLNCLRNGSFLFLHRPSIEDWHSPLKELESVLYH